MTMFESSASISEDERSKYSVCIRLCLISSPTWQCHASVVLVVLAGRSRWITDLSCGCPRVRLVFLGEWTWHRVPVEPDMSWNMVGVAVAALLYLTFVEAGARRFEPSVKLISSVWNWHCLADRVAAGFVCLVVGCRGDCASTKSAG